MSAETDLKSSSTIQNLHRLRLAAVINWRDPGRWIWEYLPGERYEADLLFAAPEPGASKSRRVVRTAYVREFLELARRRPDLDRYDVIFAWELRATLATVLLRRLRRQRRARLVAVAPILKGRVLQALPLVRRLLADADRIVCFSSVECDTYARLLRLPRRRFLFLPLAWLENVPAAERDEDYILALGHSNRDYPLLLEAIQDTELPVTIVSANPGWLKGRAAPPNVTLRYNTAFAETNALVAGAALHVIPLGAGDYASGQNVLLRAMAAGKAVVLTDTPGIRDYVRDGDTGVLVPPGDPAALRAALLRLWHDPDERRRIGTRAARAVREEFGFSRLARDLADIAEELTAGI